MQQKLIYAAPAEDVRDIFSAYYFVDFPHSKVVFHERAAIAQVRFIVRGGVLATVPGGNPVFIDRPVIYGPTTGQTIYDIPNDLKVVGSGLLPCGWHAMTRRSASDYLNCAMSIETQFPGPMSDMIGPIADAATFEEMITLLDQAGRELNQMVDPDVRKFVHLVDQWLISAIAPAVSDLYDRTSLSRRQVERLVKHLYGVPPKQLARKYRALRTAKLLHARNAASEDYADAFYDQSHMIRELKHFTGQTPQEIRFDDNRVTRILDTRSALAGKVHPLTALT